MKIGHKTKAVGTVLASCALVLGIATSASATTKVWADDAGYAEWNADPEGSIPGDSIQACDTKADGWGVKAVLALDGTAPNRTASTAGHPKGYCTGWKSGNLPEGNPYLLSVYKVQGDTEILIDYKVVNA
ncbi:hypothetical protein ABZ612_26765 [Streptomyces avermitilis]|uniref:hypothetical protein n=1 Tax=Streptomyces avermitilis TaxID=33903 RepID=UPI0033F53A1E